MNGKQRCLLAPANDEGRMLYESLRGLELLGFLEILGFCDNDSRWAENSFLGLPVRGPDHWAEENPDRIIIASIFYESIKRSCHEGGLDLERIEPFYKDYQNHFDHVDRSFKDVTIGRYSYYKRSTQVQGCDIGRFCHIGADSILGLSGHDTARVSTYPLAYHFSGENVDCAQDATISSKSSFTLRTKIGNDVYIGNRCCVMKGVSIGDGAVVGTGSIVTHDVRPYAIVAGVPAREIRRRFSDDVIQFLLHRAWWNDPDESIAACIPEINGASSSWLKQNKVIEA